MRQLAFLLAFLWLSVVVLILSGGGVRLMEAGLSIVEWDVVGGIFPPFSQEAWEDAFARYRGTEQFEHLFPNMSMDEFKSIYWWEWGHRFLARCIGLFYIVTLFFSRRILWKRWKIAKWVLLSGVLFFFQSIVGWWMVRSGFEREAIFVAPVRLGIHMLMAFAVLGTLFRSWLLCFSLGYDGVPLSLREKSAFPRLLFPAVLCGLFLGQIFLGVLNAAERHRFLYASWDVFWQIPLLGLHGFLAMFLCLGAFFQWINLFKKRLDASIPAFYLLGGLVLQGFLGVALIEIPWEGVYLLLFAWVHQMCSVLIWLCLLWLWSVIIDKTTRESVSLRSC